MPELPEVETIVRDLRPSIMGRVVTGLIMRDKALNHLLQTDPRKFSQGIMNQTVTTVLRKGKYIIVPFSNSNVVVFHLGMTGKILIKDSPDVDFIDQLSNNELVDKHTHLLIELMDPSGVWEDVELHFNDVRLFGNIWLLENVTNIDKLDVPGLRELGPDALGISAQEFSRAIYGNRPIKSILLDQSKIAGVGNIYADEACFCARIHPTTKGSSLTEEQQERLRFAIKTVLKQGIKFRGSSTSDYVSTDGGEGSYQKYHRVYQKTGQACVECSTPIARIKLVGRSTHFCPKCQGEISA